MKSKLRIIFFILISFVLAMGITKCHAQESSIDQISHLNYNRIDYTDAVYTYSSIIEREGNNQALYCYGLYDTAILFFNWNIHYNDNDSVPWKAYYYKENPPVIKKDSILWQNFQLNYNDYDLDMGWLFFAPDSSFCFKDSYTGKWILSEMDSLTAMNEIFNAFDSVRHTNVGLRKRIDALMNIIILYEQRNQVDKAINKNNKNYIYYENKINEFIDEYDSLTKIYP